MKTMSLSAVLAGTGAVLALALAPCVASAGKVAALFDASDFVPGAAIDNPYWPLIPGSSFVYTAESGDGCEVELFEVTNQVKSNFPAPYDTIVATEIRDRAWLSPACDGNYALVETTRDWHAQDKTGNVWYFGEATEAYDEDECPSTAGSWTAGADGAEPGIIMLAEPETGATYRQEYSEGIAEDMARVLRLDASVSTGAGDFAPCLETREWSPLEPGAVEHKYYCPSGGGLRLIEELKGKTLRTELVGDTLPPGSYARKGVCP